MTNKAVETKIWEMVITDCQEMPLRTEQFETAELAVARYEEINATAAAVAKAGRFPSEYAEKPYARTRRVR